MVPLLRGGATGLLRVLVAEDDANFRETVLQVLSIIGECSVVAAVDDGDAAVEAALSLRPDAALLDVGLPCKSGLEVARQFRFIAPNVRVVLLLSDDRPTYHSAVVECGAAWVAKDRLDEMLQPVLGSIVAPRRVGQDGGPS